MCSLQLCFIVYKRYFKLKFDYYVFCSIDFRFYFDLWNGIYYCLYCFVFEKEGNCLLFRELVFIIDVYCQVWVFILMLIFVIYLFFNLYIIF